MTDMNFRSDIIERSLPMVSSQAPIRKHPTQSSPYEEESVYRVSTENPLHSGVAISFHKNDRIYRVNDILSGHITILSKDGKTYWISVNNMKCFFSKMSIYELTRNS